MPTRFAPSVIIPPTVIALRIDNQFQSPIQDSGQLLILARIRAVRLSKYKCRETVVVHIAL